MKTRILLAVGITILLAHDALAANPRQRRAPRKSAQPVAVQETTAAAVRPTETLTSNPVETVPAPPPSVVTGDAEDARYQQVKLKAKQDPEVRTLKAQADQAANPDTARRTSVAYNQTLFRKMRQMDGSLKPRIDLVEAAIMRRINIGE